MPITQLYTAIPGDVITAARWNNEFGNLYDNAVFSTGITATSTLTERTLEDRFAERLNVKDFGAIGNGVADDTTALAAVAAVSAGQEVWFPSGTYLVTSTVTWPKNGCHLRGEGVDSTFIKFAPTASGQTCFKFQSDSGGNNLLVFSGLRGMTFTASGNTQNLKVAVEIITAEEFFMEDFRILNWSGTALNCIGIKHSGWQLNTFSHALVYADIPVYCGINPWVLGGALIELDLDFCSFSHMVLAPDASQPCVRMEDGLFVSNSTFDDIAFVGGTKAVEWIDLARTITNVAANPSTKLRFTSAAHGLKTGSVVQVYDVFGCTEANVRAAITVVDVDTFDMTSVAFVNTYTSGGKAFRSPGNSYNLKFTNCRREQSDAVNDYCYYFDRIGSPVEGVTFVSCYMDSTCNGIYARKIRKLLFNQTVFAATAKRHIDYPSEAQMAVVFEACVFPNSGTSTAHLPGFKQLVASEKNAAASPLSSSATYVHETQVGRQGRGFQDGLDVLSFEGQLTDDEFISLECGSSIGNTLCLITAAMTNDAGVDEGMSCFASTGTNVFKIAGTTNTAVADTDGNLCVYRTTGTIFLKNRLATTVNYIVHVLARAAITLSATNVRAPETYVVDTPLNLTNIVITDGTTTFVTAKLVIETTTAGTLNTGTSGSVTSTFFNGVWLASGAVADVNTLLAALTFTPAPSFISTFFMTVTIVNDQGKVVKGRKQFN